MVAGNVNKRSKKKTVLSATLFLVGLGIIGWIVWRAGAGDIYNVLAGANRDWLALAILTTIAWVGFRALRWQNILASAGLGIKYRLLFLITSSGLLVDILTPVYRAGSEPVRTYLLKKHLNVPTGKGFATVILDRFFDFVIFISLAIIALLLMFPLVSLRIKYLMAISVLFLVGMLVYVIYISLKKEAAYKTIKKIISFLKRIKSLRPKLEKAEKGLAKEVALYSATVRQGFYLNTSLNALISIILIGLEIVRLQAVVLALGLKIELFWLIVAFGAVIIAGSIPSPPGGVGIVEPVGIGVFLFAGLSLSQATAFILVDRLVMLGIISLVGLVATWHLGIKRVRPAEAFEYKL